MKTADLPLRPQRHPSLRSWVLLLAGGQILFWLYTFRFIFVNSNPMGDGLEVMAIFPFGYIFLGLSFPRCCWAQLADYSSLGSCLVWLVWFAIWCSL